MSVDVGDIAFWLLLSNDRREGEWNSVVVVGREIA